MAAQLQEEQCHPSKLPSFRQPNYVDANRLIDSSDETVYVHADASFSKSYSRASIKGVFDGFDTDGIGWEIGVR